MCNAAVEKKHAGGVCDEEKERGRERERAADHVDGASGGAGSSVTACPGWSPSRQSHFPKVAVTHGAPNPAVYVTVAVKGIMA